jgi:dTDP-4-dehydrorhamnose reductase
LVKLILKQILLSKIDEKIWKKPMKSAMKKTKKWYDFCFQTFERIKKEVSQSMLQVNSEFDTKAQRIDHSLLTF